ncbi:phage baseplate assembly protein V [Nocardia amamiensis]|uniref:phage baseplate assembly protein V n=1 Tax=Nocardia amamiensis TaxID=404578 RepID=UPI0009FDB5CF|nr:phage baseplate assembly protein V [Nocardia amamiensis]
MSEDVDRVVQALSQRFFGKYRGEVTDTKDSTGRARLKVKCPAVLGQEEVWAMPAAPYAGDSVGFFALPPSGASVWVEFEAGEINQPIWSGCFWKDGEIQAGDAEEGVMFLKTPGFSIRVDNDQGTVEIEASGGAKITLDSNGITLEAPEVSLSANGASAKLSASGFDAMSGALTVM